MPHAIDHLVLACRDLDTAAETWRRMGFLVGAQNRHAWGTLNRIVQLDGAFIELITTEPGFRAPAADEPVFPFAGFIDRYLREVGEGFAMLVLRSTDAAADSRRLRAAGIGRGEPFFFERKGRRPDGSEVHVAFTLAFAAVPGISDAGFFLCKHHFPESFWSPALQRHANATLCIDEVTLVTERPEDHAGFVSGLAGAPATFGTDGHGVVDTGAGRIAVTSRERARGAWGDAPAPSLHAPCLAAFTMRSRDIGMTRAALLGGAVPFLEGRGALIVPATATHGVAIAFV